MKQTITFITMVLFLTMGLHAQQPFYPTREGVSLTFAEKNGKGKIEGYSQITVMEVTSTDENNFTISTSSRAMDKDKKDLLSKPFTLTVQIKDGVVKFDPASMGGKLMEGMKMTGDSFLLPADASVGTVLNNYTITMSMGAIKSTTHYTDIKVTGTETLNIGGQSIECLIVEGTLSSKIMGMKQEMNQKIWYAHNIGQAKMELYTKKGKLQSVQELIEITGL